MDELTPKQLAFANAYISGKNTSEAYRVAYNCSRMTDASIAREAFRLLENPKVASYIAQGRQEAARGAVASRKAILERLEGLNARAYENACSKDLLDGKLDKDASDTVVRTGKLLLHELPDDIEDDKPPFVADFGLLLAPPFLEPHRVIEREEAPELWLAGGRGSTKSSFASLEVVYHIEQHSDQHALVMMRFKNQIRDSAYAQVVWAIKALGLEDEYDMPDSTLRIRKRSTGQMIYFKGCDNPNKVKGVKPAFGYVGIVWLEETDMFRGMPEIRKVLQSAVRGGSSAVRLFTFNPPRTKACWINKEMERRRDAGKRVYSSTYLDVPPEWLGKQFIEDARELMRIDPQAYDHEYMGIAVGLGGDVFDLENKVKFRTITDKEIATFDQVRCGQDFGWWPDPWAFIMSGWQPASRTLLTFEEHRGNKLQPDEQADIIREALTWKDDPKDKEPEYHHLKVLSDDGDPTSIAAQRGVGVRASASGKGNLRMASYQFLASLNWVIDPVRCPKLAEEVREMQYEQNADGEFVNSIPDGNDHSVDAVRYSLMDIVRKARHAYATYEAD